MIADIYDGTHQTPQYTDSGVRFVSVENIATLETTKFISQKAYEKEYSNKQPEKGDVLMTRIGDIGTAKVIETKEPLAYYVTLALLKPKRVNSDFLAWLISSPEVQRNIWRRTLHIAFPRKINLGEINQVEMTLPNVDEQAKIGAFFKELDNTIALHQRKLDLLKQLKQGYLQNMFPQQAENIPRLRFTNFTKGWEQRKLKEILTVNSGRDYKHLGNGNIPVYGTGGFMLSVDKSLSDKDAIGIGRKGTIDNPQLLKAPFWTVDTLFYMIPKNKVNLFFCFSLINTIRWKKYDESTGVPSLSKTTIDNITTRKPEHKEQLKIGKLLKRFDKVIVLHQTKLDKLQSLKKAYLQKMFI